MRQLLPLLLALLLPLTAGCRRAPEPTPTAAPAPDASAQKAVKKKAKKKKKKKKKAAANSGNRHRVAGSPGRYARANPLPKGMNAKKAAGVTVSTPTATAGVNFVLSGHATAAELIDAKGKVLHRWKAPFSSFWPKRKPKGKGAHRTTFWRQATPLPNGDLLVVFEGLGVGRIDKDSKVLWATAPEFLAHHEATVDAAGDVWVLSRKSNRIPRLHKKKSVLEDFVTVLDGKTGKVKKQHSLIEAFEGSEFKKVFAERSQKAGDVLHTTGLELLDGKLASTHAAFAKGNVLVTMKNLHAAAVLDTKKNTIAWVGQGKFRHPNDPVVGPDGSILVFDNRGPRVLEDKSESRIVKLDPKTGKDTAVFRGGKDVPFYSRTCGAVQPLKGGHLLITETDNGRAFELDGKKKVVWEYWNPHRAGEKNELVASLFGVERLPADFGKAWRKAPAAK